MTEGILSALGGLGVFLLGMVVMTDGLKAMAGNSLRRALARFTKSPTSGAVTGAIATALIQSSSATTVTAVGFVGAGLITFSQALGIIFGANIGTTITGWIVAIVGFKLKLGMLALPFVLAGVLIRLFSRRKMAAVGLALSGFGLVFIGIDLMQQGMSGLEGIVTPESFPGDDFFGRVLLVGIGILITLVTQSSSAGIATALTAVHSDTISFEQAAVMIIGMDVGTTVTAAMATIGGSTDVRRTGFAHVIYNLLTGVMAFLLVTPYTWVCTSLFGAGFVENPEVALVGFHTFFNTLGVILVLPLANSFARLMIWLVPERPLEYTQRLDRSLYESPAVALDAAMATLRELALVVMQTLSQILTSGRNEKMDETLNNANEALKKTRDFLAPIETSNLHSRFYSRKLSAIHAVDHLRRLIDRCQEKRARRARESELEPLGTMLIETLQQAQTELVDFADVLGNGNDSDATSVLRFKNVWQEFETEAEKYRHDLIAGAASGAADAKETIGKLDTLRWIRRVSYHVWRIMHYLVHSAPDRDNPPSGSSHQDSPGIGKNTANNIEDPAEMDG